MAPLSFSLVDTIIDHKHFGSHLNSSKKTTNVNLEKKNFFHAQKALASIFNNVVVDEIEVVSEALYPPQESVHAHNV